MSFDIAKYPTLALVDSTCRLELLRSSYTF